MAVPLDPTTLVGLSKSAVGVGREGEGRKRVGPVAIVLMALIPSISNLPAPILGHRPPKEMPMSTETDRQPEGLCGVF